MSTFHALSVLSVLLAAALPLACTRQGDAAGVADTVPRAPVVGTLELKPQPFTESITTFGVFEATEEIELAVDFTARVTAVHFDEGQRVEAGQTLVEFDARRHELRMQRATSMRNAAHAELGEAQAALRRRQELAAGGIESGSQLESAVLAEQSARARYEDAVAGLALAERDLEQVTLVSPASGVVHTRSVDSGETPTAGTVLGTIEAIATVRVVTYISQKDINHLRVGAEAAVTTPGVPGRQFTARIQSLGIKADARTGNFVVKLALSNSDGLLRPGMTARVELEAMALQNALVLPDTAIVHRNRRRVVFKVVDGTAVRVEPLLLAATGAWVPVLDGLAPGDEIIVSGLQHVVDGSPVRTEERP